LVEDNIDSDKIIPGVRVILLKRPWNEPMQNIPGVEPIDSLKEILDKLL